MSENASHPSSPSRSGNPSAPAALLRNSRDCKAYLLSLPGGDAALHHAIKQAKQSVHSQAGAMVLKLSSKCLHLVQHPINYLVQHPINYLLQQGAKAAEHVQTCIQRGLRLLTQSGSTSSGTSGAGW